MKSGRLRHFCEVCRKQCKDENGYTCHVNSAAHQNRLRELATNPQQHIQKYSKDFQFRFIQLLKRKYPGETKNIQDLYEQYKQQGNFIKFNLTEWRNLEQFIEHLQKTGRNLKIEGQLPYCNITYLVNKTSDFITKKRQEQIFQKRQRQKQISENRIKQKIEKNKQIQEEMFKIMRSKILAEEANHQNVELNQLQIKLDVDDDQFKRNNFFTGEQVQKQFQQNINYAPRKLKNADKLLLELQQKNQKNNKQNKYQSEQQSQDDQEWVTPGIIVKILPHEIPEAFHNKKSTIIKITQPFIAQVKIGNATLDIDQTYLETVIPKIGHQVKIIRGQHKGKSGILEGVEIQKGIATINLGQKKVQLPFIYFSKMG